MVSLCLNTLKGRWGSLNLAALVLLIITGCAEQPLANLPVVNRAPFNGPCTIVIQEEASERYYILPSHAIDRYKVAAETWGQIGENTVVFTIPDNYHFEILSPFAQPYFESPSILIQHPTRRTCYYIAYKDLQKYRGTVPKEKILHWDMAFMFPTPGVLFDPYPSDKN